MSPPAADAVLKMAAERDWPLKISEGVVLRISVSTEPLELAVTEKTEPIADVKVRPGERRPRRPTGALVVSLTAGYQARNHQKEVEKGHPLPCVKRKIVPHIIQRFPRA